MGQNVEVIYSYNFQMMDSSKAETDFHSSAMNKLRMSGVQIRLRVHTKLRNKDFQKEILKTYAIRLLLYQKPLKLIETPG